MDGHEEYNAKDAGEANAGWPDDAQAPIEPDYSQTSVGLTDLDVRNTMLASIRLLAVFTVVAAGLFWWKAGWQSALLLLVGALISSTSLWEWLRLMTAINQRMDAGLNRVKKQAPWG